VLKDLAEYAGNSDEKDFLLKLSKSTPEGKVCFSCVMFVYCMMFFEKLTDKLDTVAV